MPTHAAPRDTTRGADHQCAGPGCNTQIPADRLMCDPDWALLPAKIRRKLNYTHPRRRADWSAYAAAIRLARSAIKAAKSRATQAAETPADDDTSTLSDALYDAIERAIADNYHGTPISPSAVATVATPAVLTAIEEYADADDDGRQALAEGTNKLRDRIAELKADGVREFAGYLEAHPLPGPYRSGRYAELAREKADRMEAGETL